MRRFTSASTVIALAFLTQTSLLGAQGSALRTGLWVTQKAAESAADPAAFESALRHNPHLSGVCLHAGWKEIESEAGKLDFSAIDKTVAVLRRIGMKYELSVKPGADTPPFVFAEGAKSIQTEISNPHRANFGQAAQIPVPWDPIYQRHFSQLIERLGQRYASDPLCVGVVLTCANFMSAEMHLPHRPEDRAKWQALGDYRGKLLEVYKKYTDEWAKAFPRQQVSLHLAKVLDLPASFNEQIIEYGLSKYPAQFTIQNCQLTGRREDTGTLSYDLVLKYGGRLHHGFQSLAALARGGERMGSLQMAVLNVIHGSGEYWELWHGDGLSAETSGEIAKAWEEGKRLGYDGYKKKLISEGNYRESGGGKGKGRHRKRGGEAPEQPTDGDETEPN